MQHVVNVADGLPFGAVDHVVRDATVFTFVGPHYALKTKMSTTALVLTVFSQVTAKMHPLVLSGRIGVIFGTLEELHGRTKKSRFLHIYSDVFFILYFWLIYGKI